MKILCEKKKRTVVDGRREDGKRGEDMRTDIDLVIIKKTMSEGSQLDSTRLDAAREQRPRAAARAAQEETEKLESTRILSTIRNDCFFECATNLNEHLNN